jgi:hypothetical protein
LSRAVRPCSPLEPGHHSDISAANSISMGER